MPLDKMAVPKEWIEKEIGMGRYKEIYNNHFWKPNKLVQTGTNIHIQGCDCHICGKQYPSPHQKLCPDCYEIYCPEHIYRHKDCKGGR